jgi:acyl carrier protein
VALPATNKGEAEITAWCVAHLAKALRCHAEKIDPHTKFARLGVDSAMAVYLVAELEEWLGRELAPEVAFEYPTIAELAHYLAGEP